MAYGGYLKTMKEITLKEFREKYDGAPYSIDEVASIARHVKDCKTLKMAAKKYLEAEEEFLEKLKELDFEIG